METDAYVDEDILAENFETLRIGDEMNVEQTSQEHDPSLDGDGLFRQRSASRSSQFDNSRYCNWPLLDEVEAVQILLFILTFCSLAFSLSRRSADVLLALLKCLMEAVMKNAMPGAVVERIMNHIPHDSRKIRSKFPFSAGTKEYAVCPKCHTMYAGACESNASESDYPEECTFMPASRGGRCNTRLLDGKKRPLKKFVYNSVYDFIGALISRRIVEEYVDNACDELLRKRFDENSEEIRGPFQAQFLRRFEGPQPGTLFIARGDELRLAFSVCIDFFNVEGVSYGAARMSVGAITLVCLNLPENIRYHRENMYLAGVIPGPKEPSYLEISNYLSPLVDEFLTLWNPGMQFSQTGCAPRGRLVRAAIAIVVCDLPAARKVAGLLSYTSNNFLCSHCKCPKQKIWDVDRQFSRRETVILRQQATAWRDASNRDRKIIERQHGVRWSELWRLPYWDPNEQLVVDPMHCLLLGLVHNHFSTIFPLTENATSESPPEHPPYSYQFLEVPSRDEDPENAIYQGDNTSAMSEMEIQRVPEIHALLLAPIHSPSVETFNQLRNSLEKKPRNSLLFVWSSLELPENTLAHPDDLRGGQPRNEVKKIQYAGALARWRFEKPFVSDVPSIRLTTNSLMNCIRMVISTVSKPSWVRSVPTNFGSSSAGKIKADEWRTLATVHLPLALTCHLFLSEESRDVNYRGRFDEVFDHTMELVQAVCVLFRKSTSIDKVEKYNRHIRNYIRRLQKVHPSARFLPNMHMATHVSDFLPLFGSVYSWWTFPFERMIGVLQNLPSNNKIGQLEATISDSFVAFTRMKQCFSRDTCPAGLQSCLEVIEAAGLSASVQPSEDKDNDQAKESVEAKEGNKVRCKWNNIVYSTRKSHVGNSQIIFQSGDSELTAGFIDAITGDGEPDFSVRPICPTSGSSEHFSRWNDCPMAVCDVAELEERVVSCRAIRGHFAAVKILEKYYVIRPLFEV